MEKIDHVLTPVKAGLYIFWGSLYYFSPYLSV